MAASLHHAGDGLAKCRSRPGSSVLVAVSSVEKSLLLPTGTWNVRISHDRDRSYRSEVDSVADGGSPCRGVFRLYVWVEVLNEILRMRETDEAAQFYDAAPTRSFRVPAK